MLIKLWSNSAWTHIEIYGLNNQIFFFFLEFEKNSFFPSCTQFSSVTQSCLTLCDPMDCSTPRFPVYHQLLEFTQTHVHRVGDAIQPSHPLSSPFPPAFSLSQHQGLFNEAYEIINYPFLNLSCLLTCVCSC